MRIPQLKNASYICLVAVAPFTRDQDVSLLTASLFVWLPMGCLSGDEHG